MVILRESKITTYHKLLSYRFALTGLGFALFLLLPAVDQWLGLSADFKSTEKNSLAPCPILHFPHIRTYIHQFNQYYKQNFGWRNALFYQYSQLKYSVLGVSPLPQKVILGKNEWFYPGNDLNNVADQHQGLRPLTSQRLQAIAQKLTQKQQLLAKRGIAFYLLIAPDSYTIYPENLPDYLKATRSTTNFDYVKAYLKKHTTIPLIDIRSALLTAKARHSTYLRTDTHWSNYGALVATLATIKAIRENFPTVPLPNEKQYQIQPKKGYDGDLITMLALNQTIPDEINYQISSPTFLNAKEIEAIADLEQRGWPSQRFISSTNNAPRLLLVGDSFTLTLRHFVPGYFSQSYILRSHFLSDQLISSEKVDIVLFELVERDIANLASL